jgi:hypothetical protein
VGRKAFLDHFDGPHKSKGSESGPIAPCCCVFRTNSATPAEERPPQLAAEAREAREAREAKSKPQEQQAAFEFKQGI